MRAHKLVSEAHLGDGCRKRHGTQRQPSRGILSQVRRGEKLGDDVWGRHARAVIDGAHGRATEAPGELGSPPVSRATPEAVERNAECWEVLWGLLRPDLLPLDWAKELRGKADGHRTVRRYRREDRAEA